MLDDDIPIVHGIECEASLIPWSLKIFYDCMRVGYECLLLCGPDSQIMGFSVLDLRLRETHLYNFVIDSNYQGQGLGDRFLKALLKHIQSTHSTEVQLEVRVSNIPAIRLYEKNGFVNVGYRKNYYSSAPPEDALLYTLKF